MFLLGTYVWPSMAVSFHPASASLMARWQSSSVLGTDFVFTSFFLIGCSSARGEISNELSFFDHRQMPDTLLCLRHQAQPWWPFMPGVDRDMTLIFTRRGLVLIVHSLDKALLPLAPHRAIKQRSSPNKVLRDLAPMRICSEQSACTALPFLRRPCLFKTSLRFETHVILLLLASYVFVLNLVSICL